MSLYACSYCGERKPGKLAQATWAWYTAGNNRVALRQRLCTECYVRNVAQLEVSSREYSLTCPACGISTDGDMDPVYLTVYVPQVGKVRLELPMCDLHAAEVRLRAEKGSWVPEDRDASSAGRGPQTNNTDAWSALGIEPRAA